MKLAFFILLFQILIINTSYSQTIENENKNNISYSILDKFGNELKYYQVVKLPLFPGGLDSLYSFIDKNIRYPIRAKQDGIQGQVRITFTIDTIGSVQNIQVLKSVRKDIDSICIDVVSRMPLWEAGVVDETEKVSVRFVLPLNFKLEEKK